MGKELRQTIKKITSHHLKKNKSQKEDQVIKKYEDRLFHEIKIINFYQKIIVPETILI